MAVQLPVCSDLATIFNSAIDTTVEARDRLNIPVLIFTKSAIKMPTAAIHDRLLDERDRARLVQQVVLTGTPVDSRFENSVSHWRIFLKLTENHLVIIEMAPGGGADLRTGLLFVKTENATSLSKDDTSISLPIMNPFSVTSVLDLIIRHGRERYRYDETISGCRFWCMTVLGDMEAEGYVADGAVEHFKREIDKLNSLNPDRFPLPTRKGEF